jgi:hypothetical protein
MLALNPDVQTRKVWLECSQNLVTQLHAPRVCLVLEKWGHYECFDGIAALEWDGPWRWARCMASP